MTHWPTCRREEYLNYSLGEKESNFRPYPISGELSVYLGNIFIVCRVGICNYGKNKAAKLKKVQGFFRVPHIIYVTGFWKISPNVTFYCSNIYHQNKEWELPINSTVVAIFSSCL